MFFFSVYALKANTIKSRTIISCTHVKELTEIKETEKGLLIGAAVTFGELEETLMDIINNKGITATFCAELYFHWI